MTNQAVNQKSEVRQGSEKRVAEKVKIETVRMTIVRDASLPEEDLIHTLLTEVMGNGRSRTDEPETDIVMSTTVTTSDAVNGPPILGAEGASQQLSDIPIINSNAKPDNNAGAKEVKKSGKQDTVRMTINRNTMMPNDGIVEALLAEATDGKSGGFFFQEVESTTSENVEKQDFTHANDCLRHSEPAPAPDTDEVPQLADDMPTPSWGVEESQPAMPKADRPAKKADYSSAAEKLLAQLKAQE